MQLSHRRNHSVKIVIKQGLFNKKKSLMVAAARDLSAGDVLSVDMAPGKLESQVRAADPSDLSATTHGALLTATCEKLSWCCSPAGHSQRMQAGATLITDILSDHAGCSEAVCWVQALLDYGVFDLENPRSGYLLQLSLPDEDEDRCYYDKEGILEDKGLATAQSFTLAPREAPPENMLAFLRLMNVQGVASLLEYVH